MKFLRFFLILYFLVFINVFSKAQGCDCRISDVESNTVNRCAIVYGVKDTVETTEELRAAINLANNSGGNRTILIADGTYQIASTSWYPYITASDVVFRSLSGNRDAVILTGNGMKDVAPLVENGFYFVGDNCVIADLTIKDLGNHGIAVEGDHLLVHNVKIQNTFEQMIKGTSAGDGADFANVQCSLFEYPAGVGPQFYIGGLDIHEGSNWLVNDNIFKNIASPSGSLAEHAIHFWDFSSDNVVERNLIVNCDRGIGFGLGSSPNENGIIRNNMIYNDGASQFHDVGIGLESSPNTKVYNNTIYIEYPNAIEYRFAETTNVEITNNLCNKAISSRNDGQATLSTNLTIAQTDWFLNLEEGNLKLASNIPELVDQGAQLYDLNFDIDQTTRPQGNGFDIGAHEYIVPTSLANIQEVRSTISLFPNPASDAFTIKSEFADISDVTIYNTLGQRLTFFEGVYLSAGFEIDVRNWHAGIYICQISRSKQISESIRIFVLK